MRRTRSEGCHCGRTELGTEEAELRRKALEEGEEREELEEEEEKERLVRPLSRFTDEILVVVVGPEFLRCGGTYDIVFALSLYGKVFFFLSEQRFQCMKVWSRGDDFFFFFWRLWESFEAEEDNTVRRSLSEIYCWSLFWTFFYLRPGGLDSGYLFAVFVD